LFDLLDPRISFGHNLPDRVTAVVQKVSVFVSQSIEKAGRSRVFLVDLSPVVGVVLVSPFLPEPIVWKDSH